MKELYVGIDPSINSTGITINIYEDNSLFTEVFYIIKGNKLTKKEQKISEDDDLKAVIYKIYEKRDIKDATDSHELELIKTHNLLNIVDVISHIIDTYSKHCDIIYVGMEGLSYGSSASWIELFNTKRTYCKSSMCSIYTSAYRGKEVCDRNWKLLKGSCDNCI